MILDYSTDNTTSQSTKILNNLTEARSEIIYLTVDTVKLNPIKSKYVKFSSCTKHNTSEDETDY